MKFRFTIRDLMWLTLVVGLIVILCIDHNHMYKSMNALSRRNQELFEEKNKADEQVRGLKAALEKARNESEFVKLLESIKNEQNEHRPTDKTPLRNPQLTINTFGRRAMETSPLRPRKIGTGTSLAAGLIVVITFAAVYTGAYFCLHSRVFAKRGYLVWFPHEWQATLFRPAGAIEGFLTKREIHVEWEGFWESLLPSAEECQAFGKFDTLQSMP